jgi:radical SAM superfamily enzyme YgiQ (UPF0313 family)/outer membrane murein-binding lipoprotein Lpp
MRTAPRVMKVILISTYELGHQPFGLASPAAWLRARGATVTCLDLSREALREDCIREADLVAFYVPMHTATRLATQLIDVVKTLNPGARLCFYGLYAPVNEAYLRARGVSDIFGGEFEAALAQLVDEMAPAGAASARTDAGDDVAEGAHGGNAHGGGAQGGGAQRDGDAASKRRKDGTASVGEMKPALPDEAVARDERRREERSRRISPVISLERLDFIVPDRTGLVPLREYAHVMLPDGGHLVAGYTEASRGCKHLCRHCPIVPVYGGVFRIVPREIVLEDIRRQVAAGAEHITFGDPDFFNGPAHALAIVREMHREFPRHTYDVTIKVEHLLKHSEQLAVLRDTGCLFVTTAVEAVDDAMLERLAKGHTRVDFLAVVGRFRELGLVLQPTFVPFTPWTTLAGYRDLLAVIAEQELIENIAPIQLGIRLLIPAGSRLLELAEMRRYAGAFDPSSLFHPWKHDDARVDALAERVQQLAAMGDKLAWTRSETFARVWQAAAHAEAQTAEGRADQAAMGGDAGLSIAPGRQPTFAARPAIPHFTEPWYCCAEPTPEQFISIGGGAPPAARHARQADAALQADAFL